MTASAWCDDLRAAVANYSRTRPGDPPAVRVTLHGGESFFVMRVDAGSRDLLISLDVYPEGIPPPLLEHRRIVDDREEVERVTPVVIVIPPHLIQKVELLPEAPGQAAVGFHIEPDA